MSHEDNSFSYRSMEHLFRPKSILIVEDALGGGVISRLRALLHEWDFSGEVVVISEENATSIEDLSFVPDLAMILSSSDSSLKALDLCSRVGVPYVVLFSRLENSGRDHKPILKRVLSRGTRFIGPESQGFVNFVDSIPISCSSALDLSQGEEGHVALISQSGALGFSALAMGIDSGVRFRYVVTTGVSMDLDMIDIGRWIVEDRDVRLIIFYIEGMSDGRAFLCLAQEARARGISVAVMRGGTSKCVRDRVLDRYGLGSSTDDGIWRAVAKQFGLVLLDDLEELIDMSRIIGESGRASGSNVAILSLSGGIGVIQADKCVSLGLNVVGLSDRTKEELSDVLPLGSISQNPVVVPNSIENPFSVLSNALCILQNADEVDAVIVDIPIMSAGGAELVADALIGTVRPDSKPILCCWLIDDAHGNHALERLRRSGIPLFDSPRRCADALVSLLGMIQAPVPSELECSPSGASMLELYPKDLNEHDATDFIGRYGLSLARQRFCRSLDETLTAGNDIGYPVVLKVVSTDVFSKKAARGIALSLRTEEELQNAYGRILERTGRSCPGAIIDGVLVQEMVEEGIECMIGMKRDPVFGPVVAVGLGGVLYDVTKDLALRLAPLDFPSALEMVESLRGYPLFSGLKGTEALDFKALAGEVVKVSRLSCAEPDLQLLDIDSAFVTSEGVKIADVYAFRARKDDV